MALTIPTFDLPSGIIINDAYTLITGFHLLADRSLELELSLWKDAEACGLGKERVSSQVFHIGRKNPSYQALYTTVANAAYAHMQSQIAGATNYQGEVVYPGDLLPDPTP